MKLGEADFWRLTLAQFASLAERYETEQERDDYHSALICCVLAEINRDPKKRDKPFVPADFMARKKEQKEPLTGEQMKVQLEMINSALGGKYV